MRSIHIGERVPVRIIAGSLALTLTALGLGLGLASSQAEAKKKQRGSLEVRVAGLPAGAKAKVIIRGPKVKGRVLRKTIRRQGRTVIRGLRFGWYRILPKAVSTDRGMAMPAKRSFSARLSNRKRSKKVRVVYRTPQPPAAYELSVARSGTGSGTVTSSPAGIDCGSDCSESYTDGTSVTLTATAAPGSTFTGWSGPECSGTGTCEVSMTEARSATATFTEEPPPPPAAYELSVARSGTGSGTVNSSPAGIDCGSDCSESYTDGTSVTLTATAAPGSTFTGWSALGCLRTVECVVSMTEARSVTATFTADPLLASSVSAGGEHTCAIRQTGQAVCWGDNEYGQLGNGTNTDSTEPVEVAGLTDAIEISAGELHTCAIREAGQAVCWGANFFGELGDGTLEPSTRPVDVQGLGNASVISAGLGHTCAIRQTGQAVCWGWNSNAQLGDGTKNNSPEPVDVSGLGDAQEIAVGFRHSCAIRETGQAVCWGNNNQGQLGDGTLVLERTTPSDVQGLTDGVLISAGQVHTCATRQTGQAVCWGDNRDGQLGAETEFSTSHVPVDVGGLADAIGITAGGYHSCAIREAGQAVCWGQNFYGQLGNGTTTSGYVPTNVEGLAATNVISGGNYHTCATRQTGEAVCWGQNVSGELGNGTTSDSDVPVSVLAG